MQLKWRPQVAGVISDFRTDATPQLNALLKSELKSKGIDAHISNVIGFDRELSEVERDIRHARMTQIIRSAEYNEALARKHHGILPAYAMDVMSTQLEVKKENKKEKQDKEEKEEEEDGGAVGSGGGDILPLL